MENILKCFKIDNPNDQLNFEKDSYGHYGFIISPKYNNKTIYLPLIDSKTADHSQSLFFTVAKLFKEERTSYYKTYSNILQHDFDEDTYFLDKDEITYASFLTSYECVVFINTGNEFFKSGLLFLPKDKKQLSDVQKIKINEVLDFLPEEEDINRVILVPKLNSTLSDYLSLEDYSVKEYKNKQYNKVKKYY